jgi:hypothetical protein
MYDIRYISYTADCDVKHHKTSVKGDVRKSFNLAFLYTNHLKPAGPSGRAI